MSDRIVRQLVATLTLLAVLAVVLEAPSAIRVPAVLGFAILGPGLAVTRFMPTISGLDRLALAAATSLALNILASLLLVAVGEWSGEPVLATLGAITLGFAFIPRYTQRSQRRERSAQRRNEEIRVRRRAQGQAYQQVVSQNPAERQVGLMALSWLLEDDGRSDEAARLRALSRLDIPPRLPLGEDPVDPDTRLHHAHQSARSVDPETRRQGLFEIAEIMDESGHADEAGTLRELARRGELEL